MHLQPSPSLMNPTKARCQPPSTTTFRRATDTNAHSSRPDFANTLPMDRPEPPRPAGRLLRAQLLPELLTTYLVAYLVVFFVTLTVLLLTTDLPLALDVVTLVARESLWFAPIVGTVLALNAWRRAKWRSPSAKSRR